MRAVILMMLLFAFSCKSKAPQRSVVPEVDLKRYEGVWYEIARYPHRFEKDLVGVTATYTLREDGKIDVLNQGYKGTLDGELSKATAVAKITDPSEPGRLKVFFVPFFGAGYFILDLDTVNYQYALVGSNSMNYLWILGRTPQMEESVYEMLTRKAASLGYDLSKLEKVPHR